MIYLDTSVALSLLLEEEDAEHAAEALARASRQGHTISSSELLRVELARARVRESLDPEPFESLLASVSLVRIAPRIIEGACAIEHHIKSLDALHLATAQVLDGAVEDLRVFAYDRRMREVAVALGLTVYE